MKKIFLLSTIIILSHFAYSQIESADIGDEFKEVSKFGTKASGFEGYQTYSSGIVNGSQFFSPSWSHGTITTNSNETFDKNYSFLFDKVRQELFIKWKNSTVILLADKNQISSFTLNTDSKDHYFVPEWKYDSSKKTNFYEVLIKNDNGYSLLKLVKTKFVKGDERDIEKQRLGEIYDAFVDDITYFISYNHSIPQQITLKEKNIKKVLVSEKNKINEYFTQHTDGSIDESFLTGLVQSLN